MVADLRLVMPLSGASPRNGRHDRKAMTMARTQLLVIALLGAWTALTLFMWLAATRSFRTVDKVMAQPQAEFEAAVKPLGAATTREVLRYLASEINRTMFKAYSATEIMLGVLVLLLIWLRSPRDTVSVVLAAVMLGLVLILGLIIEPQIVSVGRQIDFLPRNPAPAVMPRFWVLHGTFTGLDSVKLLTGLVLLVRLIVRA
jgi:hypothetical protein